MRCDCCPCRPLSDDDECAIADGKYGIEHDDGMSGCRHPYNWCKKRSDEYSDYLGKMADGMLEMMKSEQKQKGDQNDEIDRELIDKSLWC